MNRLTLATHYEVDAEKFHDGWNEIFIESFIESFIKPEDVFYVALSVKSVSYPENPAIT